MIGHLSQTQADTWGAISDKSIAEMAARGAFSPDMLQRYITQGRISIDTVIQGIDFSDVKAGARVLKKYYAVLFIK